MSVLQNLCVAWVPKDGHLRPLVSAAALEYQVAGLRSLAEASVGCVILKQLTAAQNARAEKVVSSELGMCGRTSKR